MTLNAFLNHMKYAGGYNPGLHSARWSGMLRWFETRHTKPDDYPFDLRNYLK